MNILIWNCKGALNTDFKRRVLEMMVNHHPTIMVITETRVGGDRAGGDKARRIINDLPFDGFFCHQHNRVCREFMVALEEG